MTAALSASAQNVFQARSQRVPQAIRELALPLPTISANDTLNERIVDLVQATVIDSVIVKKKQHHRVFLLGWLIHAFGGYNWRAFDMTKHKYVGTAFRNSRSSNEHYTEYDINFDLYAHQRHYQRLIFKMYDRQRELKRQDYRKSHHRDYSVEPFVRDTNNINLRLYRLHCELTPEREYRSQLHQFFYPTRPGISTKEHQNFEDEFPTMGMYGLLCLDCNHSCHPEMHPYEWVWWLKANDTLRPNDRAWFVGLFHEGSNRMPAWSQNPKTGTIRLPFVFNLREASSKQFVAQIDHLIVHEFDATSFARLNVPATAWGVGVKEIPFQIKAGGIDLKALVSMNSALITQGYKMWLDDFGYDPANGLVWGYLNLALSARDLYTAKITFGLRDCAP